MSKTLRELQDSVAKLINPDSMGLEHSKSHWICTLCNAPACQFKDLLSEREYQISGMCQTCQDSTFGA